MDIPSIVLEMKVISFFTDEYQCLGTRVTGGKKSEIGNGNGLKIFRPGNAPAPIGRKTVDTGGGELLCGEGRDRTEAGGSG